MTPTRRNTIDQAQPAVQIKEVDLARAARLVGGSGELVHADQAVDQAGLADVGTAGEGDLGQVRIGQLLDLGGPHDECRRALEQDAGLLQLVFGEVGHAAFVLGDFTRAMKLSIGFSAPKRCMMMYCCRIDRMVLHTQ